MKNIAFCGHCLFGTSGFCCVEGGLLDEDENAEHVMIR